MIAKRRIARPNVEANMEVTINGVETEVVVRGIYTKGSPDVWYLKNGDPGHPGDPAEVDDITAEDEDGKIVELDDAALEKAVELLLAKGGDGEADDDWPDREDD